MSTYISFINRITSLIILIIAWQQPSYAESNKSHFRLSGKVLKTTNIFVNFKDKRGVIQYNSHDRIRVIINNRVIYLDSPGSSSIFKPSDTLNMITIETI